MYIYLTIYYREHFVAAKAVWFPSNSSFTDCSILISGIARKVNFTSTTSIALLEVRQQGG